MRRCLTARFKRPFLSARDVPMASSKPATSENAMQGKEPRKLTPKQLLQKIGISGDPADTPKDLLEENSDLHGDLVPVLKERYRQLKEVRHDLRPGMVITWKPGLKNRRWPAYGKPAIVVAVLQEPLYDETDASSPYFNEPLDLAIGLFIDSGRHRGEFQVFHTSSERYQPWPTGEA
jgi:hypothetical protein